METQQNQQPEDLDRELQELLEEQSVPVRVPEREEVKQLEQELSTDSPAVPAQPQSIPPRWLNW